MNYFFCNSSQKNMKNVMKYLFMRLLRLLDENENVIDAHLYESGEFATIKFTNEDGTFTVSMSKEKENGNV